MGPPDLNVTRDSKWVGGGLQTPRLLRRVQSGLDDGAPPNAWLTS